MLDDTEPLVYEPDREERFSRFLNKIKEKVHEYQDSIQFRVDVEQLAAEFEAMRTEKKWALGDDGMKDYRIDVLNYSHLAEENADSLLISDASSDMSEVEENEESDENDIVLPACVTQHAFYSQGDESDLEGLVVYTGDNSARIRRALLGDVKSEGGPETDDPVELEQQQIEEEEELIGKFSGLLQQLRKNAVAAGEILREDNRVVDDMRQQATMHDSHLKRATRVIVQANKFICDSWVWISLVVVLLTFIAMAPFIRLFPKV